MTETEDRHRDRRSEARAERDPPGRTLNLRNLRSRRRNRIGVTLMLLVLAGATVRGEGGIVEPPAAVRTEHVPDISRAVVETLGRYQEISYARFVDWAPGGEAILIATRLGKLSQLHVVDGPGATPRPVTRGDEPVSNGRFLPDGSIIFTRGRGGDERYQIYRLDPSTGKEVRLSDGRSRNLVSRLSPDGATLAFTSTRRNGRDADIYLLDLRTGKSRRVFEVDRQTWWLEDFSPDLSRAILSRYVSRNESHAVVLDLRTSATTPIPPEVAGLEPSARVSRSDFFFGPGGDSVLFLTDARGEFRELVRLDLASGAAEWLAGDVGWDIERLELSRDRERAAIVINRDGYSELRLLEGLDHRGERPSWRTIPLDRRLVSGLEFSPDGSRLGVTLGRPSEPAEAFTIDLRGGRPVRWTESERAGYRPDDFVEPQLIRYRSFDDRMIPAFVFLPPQRARRPGPIPVVVTIHGGPESQYRPWFSRSRQYYACELGVAVIAPNVRGSTGYGKTYSLLDNGMKREDSVRDIGALLDWIRDEGSTRMGLDPKRVAVTGASYGGYMVLASLVHFGDRIRAGVDSVGISDFVTFLENTSEYRRHLRQAEYGDQTDPAMRAFLEKISPARRIGELRSALLLIHGENDPRVPFSETLQVVERARATGNPVWTLYAKNEGHGFARKENRDYQEAVTIRFLEDFLLD